MGWESWALGSHPGSGLGRRNMKAWEPGRGQVCAPVRVRDGGAEGGSVRLCVYFLSLLRTPLPVRVKVCGASCGCPWAVGSDTSQAVLFSQLEGGP